MERINLNPLRLFKRSQEQDRLQPKPADFDEIDPANPKSQLVQVGEEVISRGTRGQVIEVALEKDNNRDFRVYTIRFVGQKEDLNYLDSELKDLARKREFFRREIPEELREQPIHVGQKVKDLEKDIELTVISVWLEGDQRLYRLCSDKGDARELNQEKVTELVKAHREHLAEEKRKQEKETERQRIEDLTPDEAQIKELTELGLLVPRDLAMRSDDQISKNVIAKLNDTQKSRISGLLLDLGVAQERFGDDLAAIKVLYFTLNNLSNPVKEQIRKQRAAAEAAQQPQTETTPAPQPPVEPAAAISVKKAERMGALARINARLRGF